MSSVDEDAMAADEFLNYDDLMEEMERLRSGDKMFDANEWLALADKFILIGEDEPSVDILDPAIELCNYLLNRGAKIAHSHLRLSKCYFLLGQYILARRHLAECFDGYMDDSTRNAALEFQERLHAKITRDGKIGIAMIGGVVSAAILWFLSRRARNKQMA